MTTCFDRTRFCNKTDNGTAVGLGEKTGGDFTAYFCKAAEVFGVGCAPATYVMRNETLFVKIFQVGVVVMHVWTLMTGEGLVVKAFGGTTTRLYI